MRRLSVVLCSILLVLLCTSFYAAPLLGQDGAHALGDSAALCLKWGAVLGIAISLLKRMPFGIGRWIGTHPMLLATFLSTVAGLAPLIKGSGATIAALAVCIGAHFAGSQAMYQGVLKPIGKVTGIQADPFPS
jgi:hypothetical protein